MLAIPKVGLYIYVTWYHRYFNPKSIIILKAVVANPAIQTQVNRLLLLHSYFACALSCNTVPLETNLS